MEYKLTVTEFIKSINFTLDTMEGITVEGEVDDFKIIQSKWVTFALKDEESSIGCFMPVWEYKAQIENGMLVKATGQPRLRNKGFFSFVLSDVKPSGEGALKRAFLLLQQKLASEGLFDPARKRTLPRWPENIALITSRDAAAYSDFLKILKARHGGLTVSFIHSQVQGEDAPRQLISAINTANTKLKNIDAIVMIRGGGSPEDLQAFNDEGVVRAVAGSRTPTVVGIGHERDLTLAELAGDVRASTPSNAAELLVVSKQEAQLEINNLTNALKSSMSSQIQKNVMEISRNVDIMKVRIGTTSMTITGKIDILHGAGRRFKQIIAQAKLNLDEKKKVLSGYINSNITQSDNQFKSLQRVLNGISPDQVLKRGYSITRLENGSIVKTISHVETGQKLVTRVSDGEINSEVI